MNFRRLRAVARKEILHIVRDPRSLASAIAIPLMMLLIFGYALSLDVDRVPTMIYDQDGSAQSRELIRQFGGSRYFEIRGLVDGYAAIEGGIDRNQILMGVVIPRDYGKNLGADRQAPVRRRWRGWEGRVHHVAECRGALFPSAVQPA